MLQLEGSKFLITLTARTELATSATSSLSDPLSRLRDPMVDLCDPQQRRGGLEDKHRVSTIQGGGAQPLWNQLQGEGASPVPCPFPILSFQ